MALNRNQQAYVDRMMPYAIQASQATGIDPRIILGQSILETGWGAKAPGNNYFGIKGAGQTQPTQEFEGGRMVRKNESFRTFPTVQAAFRGFSDLMNRLPRYEPVRTAQGVSAQIAALGKSGYATDPNYATKLGGVVNMLPDPAGYSLMRPPAPRLRSEALAAMGLTEPPPVTPVDEMGFPHRRFGEPTQLPIGPYGAEGLARALLTGDPAKVAAAQEAIRQAAIAKHGLGAMSMQGQIQAEVMKYLTQTVPSQAPGAVRQLQQMVQANPALLNSLDPAQRKALEDTIGRLGPVGGMPVPEMRSEAMVRLSPEAMAAMGVTPPPPPPVWQQPGATGPSPENFPSGMPQPRLRSNITATGAAPTHTQYTSSLQGSETPPDWGAALGSIAQLMFPGLLGVPMGYQAAPEGGQQQSATPGWQMGQGAEPIPGANEMGLPQWLLDQQQGPAIPMSPPADPSVPDTRLQSMYRPMLPPSGGASDSEGSPTWTANGNPLSHGVLSTPSLTDPRSSGLESPLVPPRQTMTGTAVSPTVGYSLGSGGGAGSTALARNLSPAATNALLGFGLLPSSALRYPTTQQPTGIWNLANMVARPPAVTPAPVVPPMPRPRPSMPVAPPPAAPAPTAAAAPSSPSVGDLLLVGSGGFADVTQLSAGQQADLFAQAYPEDPRYDRPEDSQGNYTPGPIESGWYLPDQFLPDLDAMNGMRGWA